MKIERRRARRVSGRRIPAFRWENLESRTLLSAATETFSAPDLSGLIAEARAGRDTAPAGINDMVSALQSQLESGPLADLTSGTVDSDGFVQEVQSLESSYEQAADSQLSPEFPNVDELITEQGQMVVADVIALNQQSAAGLISSSDFATDAADAISALTGGPIAALDTSLSAFVTMTNDFESELSAVAQSLGTGASPALTVPQAENMVNAESNAYLASINAGLKVSHGNVAQSVAGAVDNLLESVSELNSSDATSAQNGLEERHHDF